MKQTLFLLFIFSFVANDGYSQKKAKPIKDTVAFMKELEKELREAMVEDFKPSSHEVNERISDDPLPVSISESALKEMNAAFINSFAFRTSPFNKDEVLIESDNFFYPTPNLVNATLTWTKAADKAGKNLIRIDSSIQQTISFKVNFNSSQFIKLLGEKATEIVRVEGDALIKAPLTIAKLKLTKAQLNKMETMDTFKVRLLKIDNDLAAAWIDKDYEHVHLYAFNAKGLPLDIHSHSSMILTGEPNELKGLKLPNDIGKGSFLYIKANGKIDYIEVVTITKYVEQKIKVIVNPLVALQDGKGKIDKERYQNYVPKNFNQLISPDTTLFATAQNLKIIKVYNEWAKETKWKVQYKLPNHYIQTAYALPDFKDAQMYLKGKLIKTYQSQGFYDPASGIMEFYPEDDEYKPLLFDEVRGTITIRYPRVLKTVVVKKGEKKFGVEKIEGNKLTLNDGTLGDTKEYLNASGMLSVRAYGKGTFPLKEDSYSSTSFQNDVLLYEKFYLGNILTVQIDQPSDWLDIQLPFIIKKENDKNPKKK